MRLNGVGGDGDDGAVLAFEGGGERAEEAGRHRQEISLRKNIKDGQNEWIWGRGLRKNYKEPHRRRAPCRVR